MMPDDDVTITLEHGGKSVETTPEKLTQAADGVRGDAKPAPTSEWSDYQDAPDCLQGIFDSVRDEHHPLLEQAKIKCVMHPKWQKQRGQEVAAKPKLADAATRARDGIDGYVVVSGPWYDDNDPRQTNSGEGAHAEASDVNRRMCAMALDTALSGLWWDAEKQKLRTSHPVGLHIGVVRRWGIVPYGAAAKLAEVVVARDEAGLEFLESLPEEDADDEEGS